MKTRLLMACVLALGAASACLAQGKKEEKAPAAPAADKAKADEKGAAKADEKAEPAKGDEKAAPAKEGEVDKKDAPETIKLDKTAKMAPVTFQHHKHIDRQKGCADCHEGEKPLFARERSKDGYKMKDMYAGGTCGKCHEGKKAFAAKTGCAKCHKK